MKSVHGIGALGVLAIKCVEKVRQKTLRKNPLTCISNQMGRESLVGKLSRGIILSLKHPSTRLLSRNQISLNWTLRMYQNLIEARSR